MASTKYRLAVVCSVIMCLGVLAVAGAGVAETDGQGPEELMVLGNDAYERGEYMAAVELYRSILDDGYASPDLYYNLGNAYLKAGQLGWAILNYTRALRVAPRDPDVHANLAYARSRMVDVLPEEGPPWILSILIRIHNLLGVRHALWLASFLWFSLAAVAIAALFVRRVREPLKIVSLVLAVILGLTLTSLGFKIYAVEARHPGIVVADEVQVMSGPGSDYAREFVLHAGTGVEVKRDYQGWIEIALSEEMRGWVEVVAVEEI